MPAYDLIIRNGTIVDGTGQDRFHGDIAVNARGGAHGHIARDPS